MRLLLLGGTGEAAEIAARLAGRPGIEVVTSLAGRTARPVRPPGGLRVGGFSAGGGLAGYLAAERIDAVLDATHPFAGRMKAAAAAACAERGVLHLAVWRPAWERRPDDRWTEVDSLPDAAAAVAGLGRRAFLAVGGGGVAPFAAVEDVWFLVRSIDPPGPPLPPAHEVVLERGPFSEEAEVVLLREHRIDVVVSRNSGGPAAYGKIAAARRLGLPVLLVRRPPPPPVSVGTVAEAVAWVERLVG